MSVLQAAAARPKASSASNYQVEPKQKAEQHGEPSISVNSESVSNIQAPASPSAVSRADVCVAAADYPDPPSYIAQSVSYPDLSREEGEPLVVPAAVSSDMYVQGFLPSAPSYHSVHAPMMMDANQHQQQQHSQHQTAGPTSLYQQLLAQQQSYLVQNQQQQQQIRQQISQPVPSPYSSPYQAPPAAPIMYQSPIYLGHPAAAVGPVQYVQQQLTPLQQQQLTPLQQQQQQQQLIDGRRTALAEEALAAAHEAAAKEARMAYLKSKAELARRKEEEEKKAKAAAAAAKLLPQPAPVKTTFHLVKHLVKPHDDLTDLAVMYGCSEAEIRSRNRRLVFPVLDNVVGEEIDIPAYDGWEDRVRARENRVTAEQSTDEYKRKNEELQHYHSVHRLISSCKCSEEEANFYLEESNGDVQAAEAALREDLQWEKEMGGGKKGDKSSSMMKRNPSSSSSTVPAFSSGKSKYGVDTTPFIAHAPVQHYSSSSASSLFHK